MDIRTIALFHCTARVGSAWGCAEGIGTTLSRLGYRVLNCGNPRLAPVPFDVVRQADLIILAALEWYDDILAARYGDAWLQLSAPKAAWYAESAHRDDRDFPFARCAALADRHYFPAAQDAVEFGGKWLPFGADTQVFRPQTVAKRHDAAFLGSIYPKRLEFVQKVGPQLTYLAPVTASNPLRSFQLLAEAYGSARIFVNLPAYSRLLVTKVTEVMACGTMLITPMLDDPAAAQNMTPFEDGRHLVFYRPDYPDELRLLIKHFLLHPDEREAIAQAGLREVRRAHTLEQRLQLIIDDAGGGRFARCETALATPA